MTQGEATRLENFEALLDDFGQLPSRVARPRTFMEITGCPYSENACSNILAFFMDPSKGSPESHGLGRLVLDALVSATGIATANGGLGDNITIGREISTDAGNRIDILVMSDERAILIENKIYAWAGNPFDDYARYLDRIAGDRKKHKILLTVFPTTEGSEAGFANLTYELFVEQMRSLLGRYVSAADARYLTMFLDFLNNLENLKKGSHMDQQFVNLLAQRSNDVQSLFNDLKSFRTDLRKKVEELRERIVWSKYPNMESEGLWRADTVAMFDNLFHHIRVSEDLLVGVDTHLDPHGWEIQLYPRDKGDPVKLSNLLESLSIPFEESRGWRPYAHSTRFAYDENLDRISPLLQEVVDKLATSQNAGTDLGSA